MHLGFFRVVVPAGPIRIYGEQLDLVPPGYKNIVPVSVWRYQDGHYRFACSHFPTGDLLSYGETREQAITNAHHHLERCGEERFLAEVGALEVLNQEVEIVGV